MANTTPKWRGYKMIKLTDLYKQLNQLSNTKPEKGVRFSACLIPGYKKHRLAKDVNGYPCLLIATKDSARNRPIPVKLEHLRVLYDVDCRINHNGLLEENRFTVICCTDQDSQMQDYFLRISGTIISAVGNAPTHAKVSKAVDNLVELFRVIMESPKKSVQGLWAELLIIALSKNPTELVEAWHHSPNDKYDFSLGNQRVEVKSCTSKLRQHHFSLEQLRPINDIEVLVASILVERSATGTSLAELADKIRSKLSKQPELLLYLDQIIGVTLGNGWKSASEDRFDLQLGKKSLQFFLSKEIPCVEAKLPKQVSDVHFKVDFTDIPNKDKKSLIKQGQLFEAVAF